MVDLRQMRAGWRGDGIDINRSLRDEQDMEIAIETPTPSNQLTSNGCDRSMADHTSET